MPVPPPPVFRLPLLSVMEICILFLLGVLPLILTQRRTHCFLLAQPRLVLLRLRLLRTRDVNAPPLVDALADSRVLCLIAIFQVLPLLWLHICGVHTPRSGFPLLREAGSLSLSVPRALVISPPGVYPSTELVVSLVHRGLRLLPAPAM